MSCKKDTGCKYTRNMLNNNNKNKVDNNYCTSRTINEPRDLVNDSWYKYRMLQDTFVHDAVRQSIHPMNGFQSCLGCDSDKPVCPTKSGIAYPEHVGVDSKLRGL